MIDQTMEVDNQEEGHICRFCSKICNSGRSLGGHMRGHLNLISAARKDKIMPFRNLGFEENDQKLISTDVVEDEVLSKKGDRKMETEQDEDSLNQEKVLKNRDMVVEYGYGLREHKPKKSWKFSPELKKNTEKIKHCKECGKMFSSVRALAGHMRCHPVRKRERFSCDKCVKDFDSMKGLFGHMKCHPKISVFPSGDEQKGDLAEFTTLCPVKKKRSRIRYKTNNNSQNFAFSCLDACSSSSGVSEAEEYETAVKILMMFSRGVRDWDSVVFGAESFDNQHNEIPKDDDDANAVDSDDANADAGVMDGKMEIDWEKLDSEKIVTPKNLSQEVIKSPEVVLEENSDWEAPLDEFVSRGDFKKVKYDAFDVEMDDDITETADSAEVQFGKIFNSGLELVPYCSEDLLEQEAVKLREVTSYKTKKSKERQCPICFKIFPSGQALGGHKRAHYVGLNESKTNGTLRKNQEHKEIHNFDLDLDVVADGGGMRNDLWWARSSEHTETLMMSH